MHVPMQHSPQLGACRTSSPVKRHQLAAWLFAALCGAALAVCAAGDAPAQPTAQPSQMFEKHTNSGLACSACHKESPPATPVQTPTCEGCHGTYEKIAEKTAETVPNPHASHWGQLDCSSCHHMHKPSENFCAKCHPQFDFKVP